MILYKYVSSNIFNEFYCNPIINSEDPTISFSNLHSINDPFELHSAKELLELNIGSKNTSADDFTLKSLIHILSLTKTPTNYLMWSHYAEGHRGAVIGIDVDSIGLNNNEKHIVPVNYGNVIYTANPPEIDKAEKERLINILQGTYVFNPENLNILQKLFLNKSINWEYEEEVRVVAHLDNLLGCGNVEHKTGISIPLPIESIKEIYLSDCPRLAKTDSVYQITQMHPHIKLRFLEAKHGSYDLHVSDNECDYVPIDINQLNPTASS